MCIRDSGGYAYGGAIEMNGGTLRATNSQFFGNAAIGGTGGTGLDQANPGAGGYAYGGAVHSATGSVTFVGCLLQTNSIFGGGAGYAIGGSAISGAGLG